MRFSFLIVLNSIIMVALGFLEFKDLREARAWPLIFVLIGVLTLTMNNTIINGSKSIAKVVLIFLLISLLCLPEPIYNSYVRYHMMSVWRYSGIACINLITILALVNFLFIDRRT